VDNSDHGAQRVYKGSALAVLYIRILEKCVKYNSSCRLVSGDNVGFFGYKRNNLKGRVY